MTRDLWHLLSIEYLQHTCLLRAIGDPGIEGRVVWKFGCVHVAISSACGERIRREGDAIGVVVGSVVLYSMQLY